MINLQRPHWSLPLQQTLQFLLLLKKNEVEGQIDDESAQKQVKKKRFGEGTERS